MTLNSGAYPILLPILRINRPYLLLLVTMGFVNHLYSKLEPIESFC